MSENNIHLGFCEYSSPSLSNSDRLTSIRHNISQHRTCDTVASSPSFQISGTTYRCHGLQAAEFDALPQGSQPAAPQTRLGLVKGLWLDSRREYRTTATTAGVISSSNGFRVRFQLPQVSSRPLDHSTSSRPTLPLLAPSLFFSSHFLTMAMAVLQYRCLGCQRPHRSSRAREVHVACTKARREYNARLMEQIRASLCSKPITIAAARRRHPPRHQPLPSESVPSSPAPSPSSGDDHIDSAIPDPPPPPPCHLRSARDHNKTKDALSSRLN